jgi:hypothetical protein
MADNRIKVVGYATKQVFNGNIEYRNFSDDLVGLQLTDADSTFTFGNFAITSTLDAKPSKIFTTNKFSNFVSLVDLDLTPEETSVLLENNADVKLKLDKSNLCNYAYFGSLLEYIRVSLEEVITKWPASLFVNPIRGIYSNNLTVEDFSYNQLLDSSTFKINVNIINNPYQLNFLTNGTILDTFNEGNDLRNVTVSYLNYSILRNGIEYDLLGFTGSTNITNDYIFLTVKGNPFTDITGVTATTSYHIKPNIQKEELFFNSLPDFQNNLLNRFTVPKYKSTYRFSKISESGSIIFDTKTLVWPTSDGYNIDFDSTNYLTFVDDLIKIATDFDETKTNLIVRFLTAEAISDFDTVPRCDGNEEETAGQKMNRTLKIYGREYDEIKRYIDGLQYANVVTYNQLDNTPDATLKYLARTLGWNMVSSVLENDLLKNYVTSNPSTYSGMSRGYTAIEAEIEMWRRLILNSPWIWKSKGARKSIEFLFKFIGAPDGLIEFNEFIYLAKNKIDVDLFKLLLEENGLPSDDVTLYNVDPDGYPRVPNNNSDMYFQKGGLWYRQTAGIDATIDILNGNNPHVGPYDGGAAFINQFNNLIPNFQPVTVTSTTVTTTTNNLFTNYLSGTINNYGGDYFIDVVNSDNVAIEDCVLVTTTKVSDPYPTPSEITQCGCEVLEDDYALMINIGCDLANQTNTTITDCNNKLLNISEHENGYMLFLYKRYDIDGNEIGSYNSIYASRECCNVYGGLSFYHEEWSTTNPKRLLNSGYVCCVDGNCGCGLTCNWSLSTTNILDMPIIQPYTNRFLSFTKENGETTVVTPTGCSCVAGYTIPVQGVVDPNTGDVGVGCMLTDSGISDLNNTTIQYYLEEQLDGTYLIAEFTPTYNEFGNITNLPPTTLYNSQIVTIYEGRVDGLIPCDQYMTNVSKKL